MSAALAKLHIARKELQIDESAYRAMLLRLTGQESARGLSEQQIGVVLDEMKAKGWKPTVVVQGGRRAGKTDAASRPRQADHPVARKARALWISLWQLGEVREPSDAALEAFAKRQLGCERLQWADQAQGYKLIEALKAWGERAGWPQDLAGVEPDERVLTLKRRLLSAIAAKIAELEFPTRARAYADLAKIAGDKVLDVTIAQAGDDLRLILSQQGARP